MNNTPISSSLESGEFEPINLTLDIHTNTFLTEFDEIRIMVQIFYDLNDQFITKN